MVLNKNFFKSAGLNPNISSDLSFIVLDGKTNEIINNYQNNMTPHNKSHGKVQTLLEMHMLMSRSMSLLSPGLLLTPDFPDYLLSEDDPKYIQTIPMIGKELYKSMPHYRNDLYQRNFAEYDTIEKVPAPHITWGCVRTEPGTVSGTPFRGTQEIKPRERELVLVFDAAYKTVLDNNSDNNFVTIGNKIHKYIKVKGQFFDNLVQYNTWTRTGWEAEELVEWFQKDYMLPYTGMFREAGVNNLIFQRRVRDDTLMQIKSRFHLRSILYYIRTEHITNDTIMPINRIEVDVDVLNSTADFIINQELSNYYNKILERWHF